MRDFFKRLLKSSLLGAVVLAATMATISGTAVQAGPGCLPHLGAEGKTGNTFDAAITGIGPLSNLPGDRDKTFVGLKSGPWVVICKATKAIISTNGLRTGMSVRIRQDDLYLAIQANDNVLKLRISCIRYVRYTE